MCFRVDCNQCGKYSWMGCGKHVASIFANIEKGKHCMCKSWPGVVVPPVDEKSTGKSSQQPGGSSSAAETVETGK
ncbi:hypothetical protein C5167_014019 [Papaver somniferum]|uniref:Uncharacterized protein n=1 Tax=Papaver somniferum TaxID=3469 RepID=A0A4Y7J693_PAPSO|nr:hypothetical protein C5167_014019 [Papaver somniferum]